MSKRHSEFMRGVWTFCAASTLALAGCDRAGHLMSPPGPGLEQEAAIRSLSGDTTNGAISKSTADEPAPCESPATYLEGTATQETQAAIADHAWIRDDAGDVHLYSQSWNPTQQAPAPEYLRHFVSTDSLRSLTPAVVPHALDPTPEAWDQDGLWAPFILAHGGVYYLFYTGVDARDPSTHRDDVQRIGLATSGDLIHWIKVPAGVSDVRDVSGDGCVYEADAPWTRWGRVYVPEDASTYYASECRDPFVIWDAARNRWLLFVVVSLNPAAVPGPQSTGIAVAASMDLLHWERLGYIKATKQLAAADDGVGAQQTGGIAENPFVAEHNGTFTLFFTDWRDPESATAPVQSMIQYATSPDLEIDAAGSSLWAYRGSIPDPGVNAAEILEYEGLCIMSQSIANDLAGAPNHLRDIRLRRVIWNENGTIHLTNVCAEKSAPPQELTDHLLSRRDAAVPAPSLHPVRGVHRPVDLQH